MVQTLLDYQWSIRTEDWDLQLGVAKKMLSWFRAYENFNYARYFAYYQCTQQNLQDKHPGQCQVYFNQHFNAKKNRWALQPLTLKIKLLNKQLIKCRRVTITFLVVVHQRAEELVSLSSGQQAPGDVKQDLLKARKIGQKEL